MTTQFAPRSIALLAVFIVACTTLCGCGNKYDLATVTGRITDGGQPVEGLAVEFQPTGDGSPSAGITDADGRYDLMYTFKTRGVEPGEHIVTIRDAATYYHGDCEAENDSPSSSANASIDVQRRVTVAPGRQTFDFDLQQP